MTAFIFFWNLERDTIVTLSTCDLLEYLMERAYDLNECREIEDRIRRM